MPILTGIDLPAIPDFVFATGELGDALVASWLVQQATDRATLSQWGLSPEQVGLAGGGRSVVAFDDLPAARDWTSAYTRFLHAHAPGLEVVVAHQLRDGADPEADLANLGRQLAEARLSRLPDAPLGGLGVTAVCARTGLPATDVIGSELGSPQWRALRQPQHIEKARDRWRGFLPTLKDAPEWQAAFPLKIDQLCGEAGGPPSIGMLRLAGAASGEAALSAAVARVAEGLAVADGRCAFRAGPGEPAFPLHEDGPRFSLPLCPLTLNGDELALVCDGRIARDLAETARQAAGSARVGLALVRSRTPLRLAYELAAEI